MVFPNPPQPPQLVGEVLGIGRIPDTLIKILASRFWMVRGDGGGGGLSTDKLTGRCLYSFPVHLASGVDLIPGLEHMSLLGVDPDGTVHLLH